MGKKTLMILVSVIVIVIAISANLLWPSVISSIKRDIVINSCTFDGKTLYIVGQKIVVKVNNKEVYNGTICSKRENTNAVNIDILSGETKEIVVPDVVITNNNGLVPMEIDLDGKTYKYDVKFRSIAGALHKKVSINFKWLF